MHTTRNYIHYPIIKSSFNSLSPVRCGSNFRSVIFKHIIQNSSLGTQCEIVLRWIQQNLMNEKSTLVQVMAWSHQAISHCLSQWWYRSILSYGITGPQWVNGFLLHRDKTIQVFTWFMLQYLFNHSNANLMHIHRDHFVHAPNQWETRLQCNVVTM